jgi:Asp-tRNA(Asn)/Glu-tRNA(Gln) amidotransferase A subunit family amidase
MQILGKHFDEATVLRVAHVAEHALAGEGILGKLIAAEDPKVTAIAVQGRRRPVRAK